MEVAELLIGSRASLDVQDKYGLGAQKRGEGRVYLGSRGESEAVWVLGGRHGEKSLLVRKLEGLKVESNLGILFSQTWNRMKISW